METLKKHIPNFITLLNLLCGCIALIQISKNDFEMAFLFVSLGIFFDFFDGFFARLFKVEGPLGLQLDSLADMVTSGVVPGYVMFRLLSDAQEANTTTNLLPYLGFIIALGSCYRLANFNIDIRQTDSFIGLPTPANCLFIVSLPLVLQNSESLVVFEILTNPIILLIIAFFSAYILNADISLFSLKIKQFSLQKTGLQMFFLIISMFFLVLFQYAAVPIIIITYVGLSIIKNRFF